MEKLFKIMVAALLILPSGGVAKIPPTWAEAIADVEKLLQEYLRKSDELLRANDPRYAELNFTPLSYAGLQYRLWYFQEHQCAILGRMLAKAEYIGHLEPPQPPLSASLNEVWGAAMSLDTWVYTVKRLVELPIAERAQVWNLECVGKHGIPDKIWDHRGQGKVFMQVNGAYIDVYGDVVDGFYEQLLYVLNANPQVTHVSLGSGGGNVRDAVLAGYEIRKRGLSTQLSGPCYSACPLVFIGGERRIVMRPFPSLGFHRMYNDDGPLPLDDRFYDLVAVYAKEMGVDARWLISQMYKALPEDMNILGDNLTERDELCRRRIVTGYQGIGSRVC